jgi:hypothetical protein
VKSAPWVDFPLGLVPCVVHSLFKEPYMRKIIIAAAAAVGALALSACSEKPAEEATEAAAEATDAASDAAAAATEAATEAAGASDAATDAAGGASEAAAAAAGAASDAAAAEKK